MEIVGYGCIICPEHFSTEDEIRKHVQDNHTDDRSQRYMRGMVLTRPYIMALDWVSSRKCPGGEM